MAMRREFHLVMDEEVGQWDDTLLFYLGQALESGYTFEQDYKQAYAVYEAAAEAGSADALNSMGWFTHKGLGRKPSLEQAMKLYTQAAAFGCATAAVNMGNIYESGELGSPDYAKALSWYKRGAELGSDTAQRGKLL